MQSRFHAWRAISGFVLGLILLAAPAVQAPAQEAARLKEGEKAPVFEIQGFSSESLIGKKHLLLVFYRGHF
ncbi:MAG: hypothetical protein HYZ11_02175 [Candidatus Tectomicrobia bacterium]|uniref:Alkyl hydroperoxide reductase subunit C/ Thiol specific antioxidant domain-containing protein n=1 Tax=Tectimicrobiota bacterium TaxID=2528274 RepID=A0A932HZ69_UNCTE|nr:hypothetical protein [Candidatus Tectomicrobia bacterium]